MANDFFVPFNYEPTSTTVESGTYNLAAGSYAKITAIGFNAALVADGEQLLPRYDFKEIDFATTTSTSFVDAFTVPDGFELVGQWAGRGQTTGGVTYSSRVLKYDGSTTDVYDRWGTGPAVISTAHNSSSNVWVSNNILLEQGDKLQIQTSSALFAAYISLSFRSVVRPQKTDFWVSGGASGITITGDSFIVEEYTAIS